MENFSKKDVRSLMLLLACGMRNLHLTKKGVCFRADGRKRLAFVNVNFNIESNLFDIHIVRYGQNPDFIRKGLRFEQLGFELFKFIGRTRDFAFRVGAVL